MSSPNTISSSIDQAAIKLRIPEVHAILNTPDLVIRYTNSMIQVDPKILLPVALAAVICLFGNDETDEFIVTLVRKLERVVTENDGLFMLISQLAEILQAGLVSDVVVSDVGLEPAVEIRYEVGVLSDGARLDGLRGIHLIIHCVCWCAAEFGRTGGW